MIVILSLLLFIIFLILGGFHFYWLLGGKWGVRKVIPTMKDNKNAVDIPKFATLIVGLILVSFGVMYLIKSGLVNIQIPNWISHYGYWIIPSIFILRAVGEYNYVGFFKKVKNTEFAEADSKIFSPLCLTIGLMGMLIQILK